MLVVGFMLITGLVGACGIWILRNLLKTYLFVEAQR